MQYTSPRDLFEELVQNVGKEGAKKFATAIERFLEIIQKETEKEIVEKKENIKAELYNELRNELATKEFVRAEINGVKVEMSELKTEMSELKTEIKQNALLLKLLIGIAVFALTIFNPNFITLIEKIVK